MRKIILLIITLASFSLTASAQGIVQWAKAIGSNNTEFPSRICSDNFGNSYVGGSYYESLIICNDTLDTVIQPPTNQTLNIFISKFDSNGNCIWTKTGVSIVSMINSPAYGSEVHDIEFFDGRIYCTGVFTDTIIFDNDTLSSPTCHIGCSSSFLLSLDATTGTINWSKCFEGSTSYSKAYTIRPYNGGIFVSGAYQNYLSVDNVHLDPPTIYSYNGYLLKFNNNGNCVWGKNIGINQGSSVTDMVYDNDKNLYLVGTYSGTINFPTDSLYDITPGYARSTFFAKYDTSGNFIWAKGGMEDIRGQINSGRLSYGNNGYLYFVGIFSDSVRFGSTTFTNAPNICSDVIVKLDQQGQFIWAKKTGYRPSTQGFPAIIATNNFGFILFSGFTNTVDLGVDIVQSHGELDNLLTQYDFDGNIIYYKSFGGVNGELPSDVYCDGNLTYFVGWTGSNYMIDNFSITNVYRSDILIGKMKDTTAILNISEHEFNKNPNFLLYPNPSNNGTVVTSENMIREITIRNVYGDIVLSENLDAKLYKFELPVAGIYFVTIFDGKNTMTKKLTIVR